MTKELSVQVGGVWEDLARELEAVKALAQPAEDLATLAARLADPECKMGFFTRATRREELIEAAALCIAAAELV